MKKGDKVYCIKDYVVTDMRKILSEGAWGCIGNGKPDYIKKDILEPLGLYCSGGRLIHYDDGTEILTYCIYNSVVGDSNRILMYELSEENFNKKLYCLFIKDLRKQKLEKLNAIR